MSDDATDTAATVAAITDAQLTPTEITTEAVLTLVKPVDIEDRRGKLRIMDVRVRTTHFLETVEPPYVSVAALAQPLTARGAVDKRAATYWTYLPEALAGHLLGLALTRPGRATEGK